MEYMIGVLFLAFKEMDRRMMVCIGKENKGNRIERLLSIIQMPISKKEISTFMPDVSETYIEWILGKMLREGKIERIGPKNSSRYIPVERK